MHVTPRRAAAAALIAAALLSLAAGASAQHRDHAGHGAAPGAAPYAGEETRAIASLSAEDVAALEAGEGWGLALPAELNSAPGPAHVLEAAEALALDAAQRAAIAAIRDQMRAAAISAGARYLKAERAVDAVFQSPAPTRAALADALAAAGAELAALRLVHLEAHLQTAALLTAEQIAAYDRLRGYAGRPR